MGKHLMFRCSESWNKQYKFIEKSAGADVEIHHRGTTDKLKIGAVSVRLKVRYLALFRANLLLIAVMALVTSTAAALSKPFSFRDDENYHFDYDDELDYIRTSIIQGLGLDRIPDPAKANISQSEYERAHREYLSRLYTQDGKQRKFFTIYATEQPGNGSDENSVYFRVPDEVADGYTIEHANLRFLLESKHRGASGNLTFLISCHRPFTSDSAQLSVTEYIIDLDDPQTSRWIELDLTEHVADWPILSATTGFRQHCLKLQITQNNTHVRRSLISAAINIFGVSRSDRRILTKRNVTPLDNKVMSLHKGRRTECHGESKKCCRHHMTVIFKELKGFEFIIQPKTFDAGYCKGRCPPRYNPAHHHALLQSLIWKENRRKVPRPCCAPSKLAELEILYFDENDSTKLKISSWKNMKVLECSCS